MKIYQFWNQLEDATIQVEADDYGEASSIMFDDGKYLQKDWILKTIIFSNYSKTFLLN
jgi:hypothetical protein|tara:strand:- start:647 stop:820 length:174 start_codon:yes stop_codon:yes gene_type:complete